MARSVTADDGTVYEIPDEASDEMVRDFLAAEYASKPAPAPVRPAEGSGLGAAAGLTGEVFSGARGVGLGVGGLGTLAALIYGARRRGARPAPRGVPAAAKIPGLQPPGAPLGFEPAFSAIPGDEAMRASSPEALLAQVPPEPAGFGGPGGPLERPFRENYQMGQVAAPADVSAPPQPSRPGYQVVSTYERKIPQRKGSKGKAPKTLKTTPGEVERMVPSPYAQQGISGAEGARRAERFGTRQGGELEAAARKATKAIARGEAAPTPALQGKIKDAMQAAGAAGDEADDLMSLLGKSSQGLAEMRAAGATPKVISQVFSGLGKVAGVAGKAALPIGIGLAFAQAAQANEQMRTAGLPDPIRRRMLLEMLSEIIPQAVVGVGPREAVGELRRIAQEKLHPLGRDY